MFNKEPNISEYNEGIAQIQRLHNLWVDANRQRRNGEFNVWRATLHTIWSELSRDAAVLQNHSVADFKIIKSENTIFKTYEELRNEVPKNLRLPTQDAYDKLNDLEIFLRLLQDEVGKGTKRRDPDEGRMS